RTPRRGRSSSRRCAQRLAQAPTPRQPTPTPRNRALATQPIGISSSPRPSPCSLERAHQHRDILVGPPLRQVACHVLEKLQNALPILATTPPTAPALRSARALARILLRGRHACLHGCRSSLALRSAAYRRLPTVRIGAAGHREQQ